MSDPHPPILLHLPTPHADAVARALEPLGQVTRVATLGACLEAVSGGRSWRAVVTGGGEDALDDELVARVAALVPDGVLVLFGGTAGGEPPGMEAVVAAEAAGAAALLPFPPDPDALAAFLAPYLAEGNDVPVPAEAGASDAVVVGTSPALVEAYRTLARVAPTSATVLVLGESGTGKELVARALHARSRRAAGPFVPVNCAALPDGLLEAELFGYERGAFTGAVGRSDGRFGRAHGGTLFLDEIGELGLPLQAKLLRALDSGEIERLGGAGTTRVDVRVVTATNRDLEARVQEGAFREDLLYRLAVVTVGLPPLRERPGDILPLAIHFAGHFARRYGRPVRALSRAAVEHLEHQPWPGNVRELRNAMDRGVLLSRGGVVRSVDLVGSEDARRISPPGDGLDPAYPATMALREVEERHIRRVLRQTRGHMGDAAAILGVHRNTVTAKVREYGIDARNPGVGGY